MQLTGKPNRNKKRISVFEKFLWGISTYMDISSYSYTPHSVHIMLLYPDSIQSYIFRHIYNMYVHIYIYIFRIQIQVGVYMKLGRIGCMHRPSHILFTYKCYISVYVCVFLLSYNTNLYCVLYTQTQHIVKLYTITLYHQVIQLINLYYIHSEKLMIHLVVTYSQ